MSAKAKSSHKKSRSSYDSKDLIDRKLERRRHYSIKSSSQEPKSKYKKRPIDYLDYSEEY